MTSQDQIDQARDFIMFFTDKVKRSTEGFEAFSEISQPELAVLRIVACGEPVIIKAIARQLPGVSLSSLTRILDRLEQQGYLARQHNPQDRRSTWVTLTARGRQLLETHHQMIGQMAGAMLGVLTPAERLMLIELFTKIAAGLGPLDAAALLPAPAEGAPLPDQG